MNHDYIEDGIEWNDIESVSVFWVGMIFAFDRINLERWNQC